MCSPPKACNLLSWIFRGCIPTCVKLVQRQVSCTNLCPWCGLEAETDWHAFIGCTRAKESWSSAGLSELLLPRQHHFNTLQELVFNICSRESADAAGRVAVLLWQIWSAINDVVWNDTRETSITIGELAVNGWQQWN